MKRSTITAALTGSAVVLTMLAACGGSGDSAAGASSSSKPSVSSELRDQLPEAIKSSGVITWAVQQHPPYSTVSGTEATGANEELQDAIAAKLGLKSENQVVSGGLAPVLSGLLSGRYQGFAGPVETTPEREQQYDLVSWITQHTVYLVDKSKVSGSDAKALCGTTIAFVSASVIEGYVSDLSTWCTDQGEDQITPLPLADTNATILAVKSGRAAAAGTTSASGNDAMKHDSTLKSIDQPEEAGGVTNNLGMVFPKDDNLATPVLGALKELVEDGTYTDILKKYGLDGDAVETPQLNPPLAAS